MIKACQQAALAVELLAKARVAAAQQLDGHALVEGAVRALGEVHRAHAALPDPLAQPPGTHALTAPVDRALARQFGRQTAQRREPVLGRQRAAQVVLQIGIDLPAQRKETLARRAFQRQRAVDQRLQPFKAGIDVVHATHGTRPSNADWAAQVRQFPPNAARGTPASPNPAALQA